MISKILGTALTGIGGHYLNRRWDKAILFLTMFILYGIFCWVAVRTYLFSNISPTSVSQDDMMQQFRQITTTVSIIYLSGISILWAVSLIITIVDGKRENQSDGFKWTKTGVVAAILTTLFSFVLIGYTSAASVSTLQGKGIYTVSETSEEMSSSTTHNFYTYLHLGGTPSGSHNLPAPPEGQGMIKGRIIYDNHPAVGVVMNIVLNSKYQAKNIVTDDDGVFSVHLPIGEWKINSIQTEGWSNKPSDGEFTLYYGGEDKLRGNRFNHHNIFQKDGFEAVADASSEEVHLTVTIKKDIELVWPDDSVQGIDASIADAIRWEPYPSAKKYLIKIKGLRREGTTTYFNEITSKLIDGETALPLSSLKYIKSNAKEKQEYSVEIYAFAEDGTLLGEFSGFSREGIFKLADGHILVEDKLRSFFDTSANEDPEELQKKMEVISLDRRRADAVVVLVDDNMVSEAGRLVELINSEYAKGRKEVLSGYILALEGRCNESKRMFEKALSINPEVCIPDKYRSICPQ
jgi:hypothetical protein